MTAHLSRRDFLLSSSVLACAALRATAPGLYAAEPRRPRILLRNSWQVVNIGDIAHTPGVLALLEKHIPEAEVTLWAGNDLTPEVSQLLTTRFPDVRIVKGNLTGKDSASTPELKDAAAWSDFFLHGSAANFNAAAVANYVENTGKPFGAYGISYGKPPGEEFPSYMDMSPENRKLLSQAKFVFFRDTVSMARAKKEGVDAPIMEFGPDGAFACDLRNDAAAEAYLSANSLEPGKFLCCIPRLRYTPYWRIRNSPLSEPREKRNVEMEEHDHAILRDAIAAVTRNTDIKVLVCPEDMTQMQIGRELIVEKLPDDVRKQVVLKDEYWLTDEALSTYLRSAGLFGLEMHSPIMCVGHGIPAIVGRFVEQTTKGYMWRDIGLGDWLFDFDRPDEVAQLIPTLMRIVDDPTTALARVQIARAYVQRRQFETMQIVRQQLGLAADLPA